MENLKFEFEILDKIDELKILRDAQEYRFNFLELDCLNKDTRQIIENIKSGRYSKKQSLDFCDGDYATYDELDRLGLYSQDAKIRLLANGKDIIECNCINIDISVDDKSEREIKQDDEGNWLCDDSFFNAKIELMWEYTYKGETDYFWTDETFNLKEINDYLSDNQIELFNFDDSKRDLYYYDIVKF